MRPYNERAFGITRSLRMRVWAKWVLTGAVLFLAVVTVDVTAGQEQRITASNAWVKLPASGETRTMAFANFENATMYDVYLKSAAADVAEKVELRDAGLSGEAALKAVDFVTVPAHAWAYMGPKGNHLLLLDLKRELKEGDIVTLTVTTEIGDSLQVQAVVKRD
jgi:periplasmic copper chaperone A